MDRQTVTDGVFFTIPSTLPRGRHAIDRDAVVVAQRERAMIATTELLAEQGVSGLGVREICARASLSQAAFYALFPDKVACLFAGYDRFIEVVANRMATLVQDDRRPPTYADEVHDFVHEYLSSLQSDLVVARAYQVEMDALGRPARERRREALVAMAELIRARQVDRWPDVAAARPSAYVGAVYAVRQLSSDLLDGESHPDLVSRAAEVSAWVQRMLTV